MVNYICTLCNKTFNHKGDYKRHINRKTSCIETTSDCTEKKTCKKKSATFSTPVPKVAHQNIKCNYCERQYKRNSELNRHLKTCKEKKNNNLKQELFELLLENQKKQQQEYQGEIKKLQKQISNLNNTKTINYNYNTKNIQNTQNIQILAYDKTDLSHLKDKDFKKVLKRGNFCVPNLVDAIHFNPNKPENHNIYIPNMKTGYILCWNGKTWDIRNREDVIDDIYDEKSNLLIDKLDEWEEIGYKLDPVIMTKFRRFLSKMENDVVKNKVKEELRFLLYNKAKELNITKKK
jgi:hypothetical protein